MRAFYIAAKCPRTARPGFGAVAYREARIDKVKPTSYHARSAAPGGTRSGGVAERLKAADCKSADVCLRRFESYPLHQSSGIAAGSKAWCKVSEGHSSGCSSMVEVQPSKLATWVRFPPPATARPSNLGIVSSSLSRRAARNVEGEISADD